MPSPAELEPDRRAVDGLDPFASQVDIAAPYSIGIRVSAGTNRRLLVNRCEPSA